MSEKRISSCKHEYRVVNNNRFFIKSIQKEKGDTMSLDSRCRFYNTCDCYVGCSGDAVHCKLAQRVDFYWKNYQKRITPVQVVDLMIDCERDEYRKRILLETILSSRCGV